MAERIPVIAPDTTYTIVLAPGLLASFDPAAEGLTGHVIIVTQPALADLYGAALAQRLPRAGLALMPDGEQHKSLATVHDLYTQFVQQGADRHTTIIALGGGVVGDTAGFAAATYMRGLRLVQIPTSLLAMVDSSVGGKVGVDLPEGKNLVGAFKQPERVLIDPDVLATLPPVEWRCGMAETLKHGLLADAALLNPALHHPQHAPELIRRAVQVKIDVVQADPYEQTIRAHLNLGHTFAHAIERVTEYGWRHGEAVAVGLLAAARLSQELGLCPATLAAEVEALLLATGLPCRLGGLDPAALLAAMRTDKKWQSGRNRFILLRGIGQPQIVEDVPETAVLHVLHVLQ